MIRKPYRYLAALLPVLSLAAILVGIERYGSPDNLRRRIEAEVVARQPHPEFVPTPLPFEEASLTMHPLSFGEATPRPIETQMPDLGLSRPALTLIAIPVAVALPTNAATPAPSLPSRPVVPTITSSPTRPAPPPTAVKPTATPRRDASGLPSSARLSGITHNWQTWNNCGPATLAMNLSYFGQKVGQQEIGSLLRPDPNDKNVSPEEMADYARSRGLSADVRVDGNADGLRRLIAAGVPVLIETWHEAKPNDGMGHYRLLIGYDDDSSSWIAYDSFDARDVVKGQPYVGIRLSYEEMDRLWEVYNRRYLVVYDAAHAQTVQRIMSEDRDESTALARALTHSQAAVEAKPNDPFTWFNLGSDLVVLGRFKEAAQAYDRARRIGLPWRMLWYQFGPFRAYYETGRYDEVIALADATIATAKQVEEVFFWRGLAEKAKGDMTAARASWQKALELNPRYADAAAALTNLDRPQ